MFDDPYKILGLTPDATDEQVKQAYRRLAKKYHPDVNPGDPVAAQKMNEINAAYDQIKNPPKQGSYHNAYDPFAGWQNQYYGQESSSSPLQAARHFIRYRQYDSALGALSGIGESQRTAEWYYLSAIANTNLGNRVTGLEHIRRAVELEPGNILYRRTLEQIQSSGTVYEQTRQGSFMNIPNGLYNCCYLCAIFNLCCGGRCFFPFFC